MKKIKEILTREYSANPEKPLELIREGIDNNVYIFRNRNNAKVIARVNKTGQIPSLKYEVVLINKLVKSSVATAKIIPTKGGKYFKKVNSRQAMTCFEYVEGAPIDYGPEYTPQVSLVKQAGTALGQFHQATINLNLEEKRKRTIYTELKKALKITEETSQKQLLQGMGELIGKNQKKFVKNNLKSDLAFQLRLYLEAISSLQQTF